MNLRWHPAASDEVEQTVEYLERQLAGLGSAFGVILRESIARIRRRPESFGLLETAPLGSGYRRLILPMFRYLVIYKQVNDQLVILAVSHPSRKPNYWLDRDRD